MSFWCSASPLLMLHVVVPVQDFLPDDNFMGMQYTPVKSKGLIPSLSLSAVFMAFLLFCIIRLHPLHLKIVFKLKGN